MAIIAGKYHLFERERWDVHILSLDKLQKCIYYYVMGTVVSSDGRFEWEDDKNILNMERKNRTRIISARLAEPPEKEHYEENYRKQVAGYE
jgi:hypothetical protein